MEKKPSAEEHFYDIAYFNKWLKELDAEKKETVIYMLEEFAKYFRGEAVSDAVECVKPIVEDLEKLSNNYEVVAGYYVIQKHTLDAFIENLKTTTNE